MFFNVIDHLKRQIDRLFKGKADLVDGKVPEDQLPERPTDTVTWDDVEGKPTEFPPAEHGHPDIAESVEDLRTTKADATEVTALGARVGTAEAGIEGLRGSLGAMEQTVDEADMRSQNAYAQARDAVGKAEAATLSAGNAYTTAMAADSKATDAVSKATDAVSKAAAAKSIAEDAQVSADDAVGYAELAVRTAESKLDSDGTAVDSAKLGGVDADNYAMKSALANKITNYGHSQEIRFLDAPDGGNVVFNMRDGFVDRVLLASVGDGESIEFDWIEGDEGKVLYVKDIATKDAVATAQQTAEAATLSAGNAYTTATAADSKATAADSKATAAQSIAEDAQVSADDAVGYAELAVRTAESKLDSDGTAVDSAKLGGVAASEYARKTDIPTRVKNDADTVRIDGEGNVYDVTNTPTDNYITVTYNTGTVRRYNYNRLSSSYYEYKWTGGNEYLNYRQSDGRISNQSGLQIAVANSGVDPLDDEQIVVSSISATSITSIVHTPQKSAKTEIKTDRLTRESELDDKVSKTGDTMTGPLKLKTTWLHLFYGGSEVSSDEEYYLKLHYDGTITHVNPDTGDGEIHVNTLPEKDGTLLVDSDVAVAKTLSGTYVTLTDRDCATVNYAAGLTLAFANASGLRQFEILIKGCVADGSIGVPSKVYRGSSDAFKLEAGDNHLSFAEQADGSFIVHRMLANTITIGG